MTEHLHGKGEIGHGNTGLPAANVACRKKGDTLGSQRGRPGGSEGRDELR